MKAEKLQQGMDKVNRAAATTATDMMQLQEHYQILAADVLARAARQGADSAAVSIHSGQGLTVTVRMGCVDTIEHENDKTLNLTVYIDTRKGSASSSDFSPAALDASIEAACTIARHASPDRYAGLADREQMARTTPELDLYHPWQCQPQQAVELCTQCEQAALDQDPRISNSEGAMLNTWSGVQVYGNSHGFLAGWPSSQHSLSCTVIARDEQGNMQREGWYSAATRHQALESAEAIGRQAGQRCRSRIGAHTLTTRQTPVLFEAPVAQGLFSDFISAISGRNQYLGTSFLLGQQGQKVFSEQLGIYEQPHLPRAQGSAPFDSDGVATRQQQLVADGVLQSYALSVYSARRLGLSPTGNGGGVHNLTISTGEDDLPALLQTMDTGLLVTELIGFGTNHITGDYSQGASGYWVTGGRIDHPVEGLTVAGNLRDVYQKILAVGRDVDRRGNILTGSVLVESMTVAGK